ncbi:MAG: TIM barrel protein [Clostridia bacterium]
MNDIYLGFNCNCFTNRYDEPEEWTKLCQKMGIHEVMFNIDLIDPYWSWETQRALCDRTLEACDKRGVHIFASFGGQHSHQHYLGHPDPTARAEAENFFRRAIRQSAYLGGKSFGTCFAIQTVRTNSDPVLRKEIMDSAMAAYRRLADYAAEVGLSALAYEMTSIERESCATFAENDYILESLKDMAVPMRVCLDLGHRNLEGKCGEEDHLNWIRRYAKQADVIDCQQSTTSTSCHWPFTEENNQKGVIRGEEVVSVIKKSTEKDILLAFELRCAAFYPQEYDFLDNLAQSVAYWRQFVDQ